MTRKLKQTRSTFKPPKSPRPLPKLDVGVSSLPKRPAPFEFTPIDAPQSEAELQDERWRKWQESPAAVGKGSASILEFLVWGFLVYQKKLKEDVDFIYQYPLMGGRTQLGGFVADFYFPMRREVWNPAGLQFHWTTAEDRARDQLSRAVLAGRGVKLIFLWETDLLQRTQYTLDQAWLSQELPR